MSIKNIFWKALVRLIQPWIRIHPRGKERRILVVSTTALGDSLWATPAIESLKRSFPESYLAVLTSPIGEQVFKNNPFISKIYRSDSFILSLWRQLKKDGFDTIVLLHASQRFVLPLCALLGAKDRIGTAGINKGLDSLLTESIHPNLDHEIVRRLKIVEKIGGAIASESLSFFLSEEEKLPPFSKRWIAIHPGSKDTFKRWPAQNFAEVGRALKKQLDCEILITGTAEEEEIMQLVAKEIPESHVADPKMPLRSFAALLEKMDLLICNDTGPFHLACALKTPVVGIYSSTNPDLCGPHVSPFGIAVYKKTTCSPCLKRKCRAPFCFLQIGTCEVLKTSLKIVS